MRINSFNIGKLCTRKSQNRMIDLQDLFAHNVVIIFFQQIIDSIHLACGRIFNRKDCIIRHTFFDSLHALFPGTHMKNIHIFSKILHGCLMLISALQSLIHHAAMFSVNLINSGKWKASRYSFLLQQLILQLPTHSHNLLEQFLNAMAVKRIMCQCTKTLQFLLLPLLIEHGLSCLDLICSHLST